MRVHFISDCDDGGSIAVQHARALRDAGVDVTCDGGSTPAWRTLCRQCDVLHVSFGPARDYAWLRRVRTARARGVAVVRYWSGLDVLWAAAHDATRRIGRAMADLGVVQLAPNADVQAALARLAIDAEVLPPIDPHISADTQPSPFPAEFTLLAHLPADRRELYGGGVVDRLIERLPGVRFLVLADTPQRYARHRHVTALSWVDDILRALGRCTAVLDVKLFPSAHRLALEAMSLGRHVISTAEIPHARHAESADALVGAVGLLRRDPHFNMAGREYAAAEHDCALRVKAMLDRFERALSPGRAVLSMRGSTAAARLALTMPAIYSRKPIPPPTPASVAAKDPIVRLLLTRSADAEAVMP